MQETWVQSLGLEDLLEKQMATHSSILAWRIPWTGEPGELLLSMGSQRVGHDWVINTNLPAMCYFYYICKAPNSTHSQFVDFIFIVGGACSVAQLCLTLCNPMDYSPPGSSVHGIFQIRILEWISIPFSRGPSRPRDWTHISYVFCIGRWVLYCLSHSELAPKCCGCGPLKILLLLHLCFTSLNL